jgi:glycosyltransferase involved in cell wall biosynthesis
MKNKLLVSVIIPMRNAETFIQETLENIIQEKDIPLEIVVINDGSTDRSVEKVQELGDSRIIVVDGPCQGIALALNTGIKKSQGDIILRCDADDIYPPYRIKQQVEWLSKNPDFGAVCGRFSTIDSKGELVSELQKGTISQEITEELCQGIVRTSFCTYAVNRSILEKLNGFRPYFKTGEDVDLQLRLGEICRVYYLHDIVYKYRLHEQSVTHQTGTLDQEFFESIARECQRQRLNDGVDQIDLGKLPAYPQGSSPVKKASEHIQGMLIGLSWQEYQDGHNTKSVLTACRAIRVKPNSLSAWRNLVVLLLKVFVKNKK